MGPGVKPTASPPCYPLPRLPALAPETRHAPPPISRAAATSLGSTAVKTSSAPLPCSASRCAQRSTGDVETFCRAFLRRLSDAEIPLDDRAEIAAVVELLQDRAKYGLSERLRKLLLPLVAAVESQMEMSTE